MMDFYSEPTANSSTSSVPSFLYPSLLSIFHFLRFCFSLSIPIRRSTTNIQKKLILHKLNLKAITALRFVLLESLPVWFFFRSKVFVVQPCSSETYNWYSWIVSHRQLRHLNSMLIFKDSLQTVRKDSSKSVWSDVPVWCHWNGPSVPVAEQSPVEFSAARCRSATLRATQRAWHLRNVERRTFMYASLAIAFWALTIDTSLNCCHTDFVLCCSYHLYSEL